MNVCYNFLIILGLQNIRNIGRNMPFCHLRALFVATNKVDANMIFKKLRFVLQEFDFSLLTDRQILKNVLQFFAFSVTSRSISYNACRFE